MLVVTGDELYGLLCDGGTAVCSGAAVGKCGENGTSDTSDVDTGVIVESLVLDADYGFLEVCVTHFTDGDVDSVYVLASRETRYNIALAVIYKRGLHLVCLRDV